MTVGEKMRFDMEKNAERLAQDVSKWVDAVTCLLMTSNERRTTMSEGPNSSGLEQYPGENEAGFAGVDKTPRGERREGSNLRARMEAYLVDCLCPSCAMGFKTCTCSADKAAIRRFNDAITSDEPTELRARLDALADSWDACADNIGRDGGNAASIYAQCASELRDVILKRRLK